MSIFYIQKPEQPPQGGRLGRAAPGRTARAGGPRADGSGGRPQGGRLGRAAPGRPGAPEAAGDDFGEGFTGQVAESDGRVVKYRRLGILPLIPRIPRIPLIRRKRCQQARPRPYLPHAPGVRMT